MTIKSGQQRGAFISLEGIEGAGKSTSLEFIGKFLDSQRISWCRTREPGGTRFAEKIRDLVLADAVELGTEVPSKKTETLLMFASRAQHLDEFIAPALARGEWVLCDRFTDSTSAYQGAARHLGMEQIHALAQWVHPERWPDLTLLFDVSVEVGLQRIAKRAKKDRMEQEDIDFFEQVRQGYLELAKQFPQRIVRIDANRSPSHVYHELSKVLRQFIDQWENA